MSFENPAQIIRSWNLQGSFSSGQVVQDKLVPRKFTRIRTPFVQTWREEALNSNLDWGSQAFSFYLPESLRVISSIFLRIPLPTLGSGAYKKIPGRFLSAGQESYNVEVGQYLRDYVESLRRAGYRLLQDLPGVHHRRGNVGRQGPHGPNPTSELGLHVSSRKRYSGPRRLALLPRQ